DGLLLELVTDPRAEGRSGWGAPGIPREHSIRGFHSVTLWVEDAEPTARVLTDTLGFRPAGEDDGVLSFAAGDEGPGSRLVLRPVSGFPPAVQGAGTVHHV